MRRTTYGRNNFTGRIALGIATLSVLAAAIGIKLHMNSEAETSADSTAPVIMSSIEGSDIYEELVQSSTESIDVPLVATPEASPYDGRFIANITDTLNVRAAASVDSELIGKMYPGCVGDIVGVEGEWTQITSGNVSGYVKTEFILTGKAAEPLAEEYGKNIGTVTGDILRVRQETSTESEVIGLLNRDDQVFVMEALEGWYKVLVDDNLEGYVSAEFLSVEYKLDTAVTIEEEQERIAAALEAQREREAAEQALALAQAVSNSVPVDTVQQAPTQVSYDDAYLLACLVSMEAGSEPYEGQLAVANVVLNRLRSGYYGSTMSDVIYAKGQFPTVNGSVMVGFLNNGPLPQAQQAANEALAGVNNIGGYTSFINVRYANYAAYGNYTIIGNHCFH
ncbi:MAG: cell wall hydrolase [Bacteroides sp.]|nr:cell wall hydrolase [Bacteroides sp.]MCM1548698.1 cell wall hydrolase [Clostridium sp.]